jgi:hypothetical protein
MVHSAVAEAAKKTTTKTTKKATKKKTTKKQDPPVLNTNSKTILKINSGLITTYEDYVKYPMNSYTLKVQNKPEKATYRWKTSNSDVVSLVYNKSKGTCRLNAKEGGSCIITCTVKTKKGKKCVLSCSVKVKYPATDVEVVTEDTTITSMECDLALDREYQFIANVKSKYTSDLVYWSIDDTEVADVDASGFVTPRAEGRTVLTAVAAPEGYDSESDNYDVIIYAIVINVIEPMEKVSNVDIMTTGQVVIQFSSEIERSSLFDMEDNLMGVSLSAMSGALGTGKLSAYLTDDGLQLYLVPETSPQGKYKLKITGLTAKNGYLVEDYEEVLTIKNETVSTTGANFVSISRTSQTVVTAVFDKTIIKPGTMTISNSKLAKTEVAGKVGSDSATVQYTLTAEMQELSGNQSVTLFGYAASGDSSEEGKENQWIVEMNFDYKDESVEEPLDTSTLPLPEPSNVVQAADTNSTVYIMFQNRIDEDSARVVSNYEFSDGPVITEADVVTNTDQGAMIGLSMEESSIPEIKEYELTISNVEGYNDSYLPMEKYSTSIKLNDNTPAYYKGNEFVRGTGSYSLILTFSETIDFGSSAKYFNIQAGWTGKNEEDGATVYNTAAIIEYEATASGSDNRVVIEFYTDTELPVGAKITVSPITSGGKSGTYLIDEGGNVVEFTSAEIDVSY